MARKRVTLICGLAVCSALSLLGYYNRFAIINVFNTGYKSRLYAPTMLYKSSNYYYITDCLHGRVIYCDSLDADLSNWKTLNDKVTGVHSIAANERYVVFDDTEGSRLLVYEERDGKIKLNTTLQVPHYRPHWIQYDLQTKRFYALCSKAGIVMTLSVNNNTIGLERLDTLSFLADHYVRSFNIIDGDMFFVSGRNQRPPKIYQVDYQNSFCLKDSFLVPNEISNTNYIDKVGSTFFITSLSDSTANELAPNIVKVSDLKKLSGGGYISMYDSLNFEGGAPYYMTHIDGHIYIGFISDVNGIKELLFDDDRIIKNRNVFLFDHISASSRLRERYLYPQSVIEHKSRKNFFSNRKH